MIIETTANQLYRVEETNDVNLSHVWYGVEMKRCKGEFISKKNSRRTLVSKAHCYRVVQK